MKKVENIYGFTLLIKLGYSSCLFISNSLVTRYLGVEKKGYYTWYINVVTIVMTIAGLGIYQSIAYYNKNRKEDIVETYFDMFFFQLFFYAALLIFISVISSNNDFIIIGILSIADNFCQQLSMLALIKDIKKRNIVLIVGAVLYLFIIVFIFKVARSSIYIALIAYLIYKIFYCLGYIYILKVSRHVIKIDIKRISERIRFGFFPMLSLLLVTINYRIDIIMLKSFASISAVELSYYSAAVSVAEITWLIPDVFKEVLFSKTANENAIEDVKSAIKVSNLILLIIIIGVLLFGKYVLWIIYGKEFIPSYNCLLILVCGTPVMSWFKIINTLYMAQGRKLIGFIVLLVSGIVNIVSNYFLIRIWGIIGAGIASCISYTICGILFLYTFAGETHTKLLNLVIPQKEDFNRIIRGNK